jgi:mannose-6-phosphate isomerase
VFDWNRVGLDGKPRELHVAESLASIDFDDFEPGLVAGKFTEENGVRGRHLVKDPLFEIEEFQTTANADIPIEPGRPRIIAVVKGKLSVEGNSVKVSLSPGEFCLVPADVKSAGIHAEEDGVFLMAIPN